MQLVNLNFLLLFVNQNLLRARSEESAGSLGASKH